MQRLLTRPRRDRRAQLVIELVAAPFVLAAMLALLALTLLAGPRRDR